MALSLNPEQRDAAYSPPYGIALVQGVPGCGKSRTLRERVRYLRTADKEAGRSAAKILVMAFNKSVQEELQEKLREDLSEQDFKLVSVKTFHAQAVGMVDRFKHLTPISRSAKVEIQTGWKMDMYARTWLNDRTEYKGKLKDIDVRLLLGLDGKCIRMGWTPKSTLQMDPGFAKSLGMSPDKAEFWLGVLRRFRYETGKLTFDDMLKLASELPDSAYRSLGYTHILADELQDLNHPQRQMIQKFMTSSHSFMGVGDPHQCFIPGTMIQTPDGLRAIETFREGDYVVSASGKGGTDNYQITKVHARRVELDQIMTIKTASGKVIQCTPQHALFTRIVPDTEKYHVYLMYRRDRGFRVGVARGYRVGSDGKIQFGVFARARQERADAAWVLKQCDSRREAEAFEELYSVKFGVPQTRFMPNGQDDIDEDTISFIFNNIDTVSGAERLAAFLKIDLHSAHWEKTFGTGTVSVNYLAEPRANGANKHFVRWEAQDPTMAQRLIEAGFPVHPAKSLRNGLPRWRVRALRSNYHEARELGISLAREANLDFIERFDLTDTKTWTLTPAGNAFVGMQVPILDAGNVVYDEIVSVSREEYSGMVYDLDVEHVHNYAANGIVVHNSIYSFAGSDSTIFDKMTKMFPGARKYLLKTNYRSTPQVLTYANRILEHDLGSTVRIEPHEGAKSGPVPMIYEGVEGLKSWLETLRASGYAWNEIMILYRARKHTPELEMALSEAKIPYVLADGSFFEQAVIQDILCYFYMLYSPKFEQAHWMRTFDHIKYLGAKTAEEIWTRTNGKPFTWDRTQYPSTLKQFNKKILDAYWVFYDDLKAKSSDVVETADFLVDSLNEYWASKYGDDPDRLEDNINTAKAFVSWLREFGAPGGEVLMAIEARERGEAYGDESDDRIDIRTIHRAKGLECRAVALWGVGDGTMPLKNGDHDEEMRLGFVAATRAKEDLALILDSASQRYSTFARHVPDGRNIVDVIFNTPDMLDLLAS